MAKQVLSNLRVFVDGFDVSGDVNALALRYGAELVDVTTLLDTTRARLGGLKTLALQLEGFYEAGSGLIDETLFSRIGQSGIPVTIASSPDVGATVYTFTMTAGEYSHGGAIGDAYAFSFSAEG